MFVWLEDGKIKVAFEKEFAPEGAVEIEVSGLNPVPPVEALVKIENGQIIKKSQDEVLQWFKDEKMKMLKNYVASLLEQTDYVVVKITEAQVLGDTVLVEQLKQKYVTQLQQRQAIREWNERMKQAIGNAKTLEELRSIEIRYG